MVASAKFRKETKLDENLGVTSEWWINSAWESYSIRIQRPTGNVNPSSDKAVTKN